MRIRYRSSDVCSSDLDAKVTMTIVSVNDAPTDILLTTAEGFDGIAENTATGITIGTLQALDVDDPLAGDFFGQHSYPVSDSRFEISGDHTLRLRVRSEERRVGKELVSMCISWG